MVALREIAPDLTVSLKKVEATCLTGKPSRVRQNNFPFFPDDPRISLPDEMEPLQ